MRKNAKKWLVGSGIAAAGAAVLGAVRRGISKHLVRLAMDRDGPKEMEENFDKVSGSLEYEEINELTRAARERLEQASTETVEIESHDGIRLVGHWYPCGEPKRIIVAMHAAVSSMRNSGDRGKAAAIILALVCWSDMTAWNGLSG